MLTANNYIFGFFIIQLFPFGFPSQPKKLIDDNQIYFDDNVPLQNDESPTTMTTSASVTNFSDNGSRQHRYLNLWSLATGGLRKKGFKPVTSTPVPLAVEDEVALLFHNSNRMSHQVPSLAYSSVLKPTAQMCANYHASLNHDGSTVEDPCPALLANDGSGGILIAAELFTTAPIQPPSRSYRAALWSWYADEIDLIDWTTTPVAYNESTRHVTQIIWKSTTEFACARSTVAIGGGQFVILCLYSPPGNDEATFGDNVFQNFL